MTAITNVPELLEALRTWLLANPNGDVQDFAAEHDTTPQELSEGWNTYFAQADFSRNYNLDTAQSGSQGATQAAAQAAPAYTPSEPPPYDASPEEYVQYLTQEVNNYQEFTTINNIEDNSINQQITAGGDVNQDFDIDNSENTVGEDGVLIRDSELDDTNVNTGDVDDGGVLQQGDENQANTGDVTATDGSAGSVFGDATSVGSGNDNFGSGQQSNNAALGDNNKQVNQQQDNDTDIEVGDTTGGDASADGGDGGTGGAGTGGAGGAGGAGGGVDADSSSFPDIDGGDGGSGGSGGSGTGGSADGGAGGDADGGDADVDIDVDSGDQTVDF